MSKVTVGLASMLHSCSGGRGELVLEADSLRGALDALFVECPLLQPHLFDENGAQREHVLILLDGANVRWLDDWAELLPDEARLDILQAVSGG